MRIELRDWFYPSNLLSLLRLVFIIPGYQAIVRQQHGRTLVLLLAVALTDVLDGFLARRLGQVSELGKILDPLADKLAILAALAGLIVSQQLPAWILAPVLIRDTAILVGSWFLIRRRAIVPMSNIWGKLATNSVGLVVLLYLLPVHSNARLAGVGLMLALLLVSSLSYTRAFMHVWETSNR